MLHNSMEVILWRCICFCTCLWWCNV